MSSPGPGHERELRRLLVFVASLSLLVGSTWLVPGWESLRPWIPGQALPLLQLFDREGEIQEDIRGELSVVEVVDLVHVEPAPESPEAHLPRRAGAVPTALEGAGDALAPFFEALAELDRGETRRVVRVLHWGDSTIADDGITGQVRRRLQHRFGDGGPGFLPVDVDVRWQVRPGVLRRTRVGSWETFNITFGGSDLWRYGLGGNVSTADSRRETEVILGGVREGSQRQALARFDVYYLAQPDGGSVSIVPRGARGYVLSTASSRVQDRFKALESERGSSLVWLKTHGDGPVTLYGVALETAGPGVTWETLGVAGSSIASLLRHQGERHIKDQVARRNPDLLVYQTGGNELTYPYLREGDGSKYGGQYLDALGRLRAGAPEAACLVIAPLDQGTRKRGEVVSKDGLERMIRLQREAALSAGCAFWDPRRLMGGAGSFGRWMRTAPRLASLDLIHLTTVGKELLGDSLADVLLDAYARWFEARLQDVPELLVPAEEAEEAPQGAPGPVSEEGEEPSPAATTR